MNLGLGTLSDLKAHMLNESLRSGTTYDVTIANIGKGIAERFEKFCNRKFGRVVDDIYETNANRTSVLLPRTPVEVVSKIEVRDDLETGWVDQGVVSQVLFNLRAESGIAEFAGYLGASFSRIRLTYTGGYFFETLEPTDDGFPTEVPDGAALLPDDLKLAWLLQCERLWSLRDDLGVNIAGDKAATVGAPTLGAFELVPEVKSVLEALVRYNLT